jgi:fructose-specific phosphotransferase system IIC component
MNRTDPLWMWRVLMTRGRLHVRLVVLGGAATGGLTVLWALAHAAGTGGDVSLVPLVLGPVVGVVAALVAGRLAGHPAGKATRNATRHPDTRSASTHPTRSTR